MKNNSRPVWLMIFLLSAACSSFPKNEDALGKITFDITGSEEAKPLFLKAHLLMHSFEFMDAAEVFREAQKTDPSCAMAY